MYNPAFKIVFVFHAVRMYMSRVDVRVERKEIQQHTLSVCGVCVCACERGSQNIQTFAKLL